MASNIDPATPPSWNATTNLAVPDAMIEMHTYEVPPTVHLYLHEVVECTLNGVKGFKSEAGGKCYTGAGAREKAVAQVQAINISTARRKGAPWATSLPEKK